MFSRSSVLSLLALSISSVVAQDAATGIKAIQAHFTQSHLVPDLFESFTPSALLNLNYPGVGDVTPGQKFAKEQVGPTPAVTITPGNASVTLTGTYTLAMVDADIVGAELPDGQTRHWLVNGVKVENGAITNSSALGVTPYAGPWPAAGSGPHRYVVVLYEQPSTFTPPAGLSTPNVPVATFNWPAYVKDTGLGPLIAANYIQVEEGTATVSLVPTSAVVSSTLAPASTGSSGTGTGTGTPKPTGSAPAGGNGNNTGNAFRSMPAVASFTLLVGGLAALLL
ncbi:phosphatidylethanolamine-binding protein [Panaeolus papilionaceus]|nr:phosphatidylethanolamine-binding protein [Panaeolus papilionaceus]